MSVSIASNIASQIARRHLAASGDRLARVSERLASGQRINRGSDDAAGLSIATSLSSNARVFSQGLRNINDGVSTLAIAEGALENLSGVTIRIRELATQAANGSFSRIQRLALDEEADQLVSEFNRVVATTKFNGLGLFDQTLNTLRIQAGYGLEGGIGFNLNNSLSRRVGTGEYDGSSHAVHGISSTLADINGDGVLDYVSASNLSSAVKIAYGNGDGTFGVLEDVAFGGTTGAIAVADFNGDGLLDIAAARTGAPQVEIRYRNADGSFSAITTVGASGTVSRLSTGDFNNDGKTDLVMSYGSFVRTSINNGAGGFTAGTAFNTGGTSRETAAADFNGDGHLDLAYVNGSNIVGVLLGNGSGNFTSGYSTTFGGARGVSIADVNDDGIMDLAVGSSVGMSTRIFLGNGDGTLRIGANILTNQVTQSVQFGDLNGDGKIDVATGGRVAFGNGDGTFEASPAVAMNSTIVSMTLGDLNGDGVLDIVTSSTTAFYTSIARTTTTNTLQEVTLASREQALEVLELMKTTLDRITQEKGNIGGMQSRLESAARALLASRENSLQAAGRILDADVAHESAQAVREGILQRTGAAILAQANTQPSLALQLLQGI